MPMGRSTNGLTYLVTTAITTARSQAQQVPAQKVRPWSQPPEGKKAGRGFGCGDVAVRERRQGEDFREGP